MTDSLKQPRSYRRRALGITAAAMVVVYFLWNIPQLDFLVYPLRLFVTYVHEAGHSIAALLTGGRVVGFVVSPDGSGLAVTAGGSRAIILPAGYLGAAMFGSLMFFLANRLPRYVNWLSAGVGAGMVVFTVLFARPDDQTGLPVALFLGVGFGMLLMFAGLKLRHSLNLLIVNVLSVMTALNAVLDLWYLMQNVGASRAGVHNDAAAFSRDVMPLIPPSLIAITWALIAVAMLGLAIWYGVVRPLRQEINETYENVRSRRSDAG